MIAADEGSGRGPIQARLLYALSNERIAVAMHPGRPQPNQRVSSRDVPRKDLGSLDCPDTEARQIILAVRIPTNFEKKWCKEGWKDIGNVIKNTLYIDLQNV